MRRIAVLVTAVLFLAGLWIPSAAGTGTDEARDAARRFGLALTSANASALRPLLPARGKVVLALSRLAQESGSFASGQVEAVFRDALAVVAVRSFEVLGMESDARSFALASARASITDRQGRAAIVPIHLAFQPEDGVWVIREIRETLE